MEKYVLLEKAVGETPLVCAENWRKKHPQYAGIPLAYAGRLDPMASGKLLILIGEECKHQTNYHGLDKAYEFSVLFGVESDSLDVLGRLTTCTLPSTLMDPVPESTTAGELKKILQQTGEQLTGEVALPYPHFSSKTVKGKPLHTWTLEKRLHEIKIPTNQSLVYRLELLAIETMQKSDLVEQALDKVNSIPKVTDPRKVIGNDFRREEVRGDWNRIAENNILPDTYLIAHFSCIAASGTYMRSLASEIATRLDTCGLAWHIHRTDIGRYDAQEQKWIHRY